MNKALAIDPGYAPAHARLGTIVMYRGDLAGAVRHLESALECPKGRVLKTDWTQHFLNSKVSLPGRDPTRENR